jgi:hypothetical protein
MGTAATIANVPQILKNIWQNDIFDFMYEDQPFLGLVDKDTSWDGLYQIITVEYGGMAGRSATFTNAQGNKSPPKYAQMQVLTRDNFALWSVDHKLITLSRNDRGALVRALAESTEKATSKLKRSSCWAFWGNGGGACGRVSAIAADLITLYDVNDVRNFDIDDVITLSSDDGTGGAGVRAGTLTIDGIDEDAGTLSTVGNVVAGIAAAVVGDYIFHQGDYNAIFLGVPSYVTPSAPGSGGVPASLWGMTRTDFPTRLAGSRFTGAAATPEDAIKSALAKAHRRNIRTTHLFASPEIYNTIEGNLGSDRRYVDEKVGTVGFKALEFTSQGGKTVKLYSDADIRKNAAGTTQYVYGLNMDTWKFHTADEYPMWLASVANGGGKFMLEENANQTEGRLGGYGQLYTKAPGQNWVLALT